MNSRKKILPSNFIFSLYFLQSLRFESELNKKHKNKKWRFLYGRPKFKF